MAQPRHVHITGSYRTHQRVEATHVPAGIRVDNDIHRYHPEYQAQINVSFNDVSVSHATRLLREWQVQVGWFHLAVNWQSEFWNDPPEDCVGAILEPDGWVAADHKGEFIPIQDPCYISGRPEADAEHAHFVPHVIRSGGIPIVSERLLQTLNALGATGTDAPIIYRGHNKAAYDTPQPGFRRFQIEPAYERLNNCQLHILPASVPLEFTICSLLRCVVNVVRQREQRWYDVAVSRDALTELRGRHPRILVSPLFSRGGETHAWLQQLEESVRSVSSAELDSGPFVETL